jgi:hypothetical protein
MHIVISLGSSYNKKMFSQTLYRKSEQTFHDHNFFPPENRVIYDIIWKNMVQPERPQTTIQPMRFACRINKARMQAYSIFNTYRFSTTTMVTRTRLDVTLYVHRLSCLTSSSSICHPYLPILQTSPPTETI